MKCDPGPCPVDDAPHTTCTSADYVGTTGALRVIGPTQFPMRDQTVPGWSNNPEPAPSTTPAASTERFTTSTYKRARGRPPRS